MYRRQLLKTLALAVPAGALAPCSSTFALPAPARDVVPYFFDLAASERKKVKITDVKVMRLKMSPGAHEMPLVKVETDAGVYGIGECHHDITGLGAKDTVLNAFRTMLIGQDPFDIDKLTTQMAWRTSYLGGYHGAAMHAVTGCEVALWDLTGKLLGLPVYNDHGEKIGLIDDIMLPAMGGEVTAVVSVGGFVGGGPKLVKIPLSHVQLTSKKPMMVGDGSKKALMAMSYYTYSMPGGAGG